MTTKEIDAMIMEEAKAFCNSHGLANYNVPVIKEAIEIGGRLVAEMATKTIKEHRRSLGQQREKANRPQ